MHDNTTRRVLFGRWRVKLRSRAQEKYMLGGPRITNISFINWKIRVNVTVTFIISL